VENCPLKIDAANNADYTPAVAKAAA